MNKQNLLFLISLLVGESGHSKLARTIYMTDRKTETITVCGVKATVMQFPAKPNKSFAGNQGLFSVNYNENDIIISALRTNAHSNLFVYMDGRRFGFNLRASTRECDEIILVKDADERRFRLKVRNE